ncbi:hypothetical protein [Carboxylicivirga linearis]|uniref:Uncharacterized protein n=1 Tax=Carboxylicivirga linearis TaxID=1628157 RepID=A0ABS5JRD9_9BACT|nr:hypothetical protein [Carboxylicivirga linearis]MBS2097388.1 hypothetical protein [Carboxylicivirga linearis]
MINRSNIEINYLRLLSVTMMLTAAYVTDAEGQESRTQAFYDVREIILDQIHQINPSSVEEGIEWEMALEVTSNLNQTSVLYQLPEVQNFILEVLSVKKKLPTNQLITASVCYAQQQVCYQPIEFKDVNHHSQLLVYDAIRPVRAGPGA